MPAGYVAGEPTQRVGNPSLLGTVCGGSRRLASVISLVTPANDAGVQVLADVVRAAAVTAGGGAEAAALVVRLCAAEAVGRCTVNRDNAELGVSVVVEGTELVVSVRDPGEPVTGPPDAVLGLVDAGVVSSATGGADGSGNVIVLRVPLPAHERMVDVGDLEVIGDDAPLTDVPVEIRELTADDAAALTRCIYRTYGWTYPYPAIYYPERIAAAIADGTRKGWVAVTPDGEVVCHMGIVFETDGVVMAGGGVTDPRFRRRGLLIELGMRYYEWLLGEQGPATALAEPVLTHPITQKMALSPGRDLVGLLLDLRGSIQQVGITDGLLQRRSSLLCVHNAVQPLEPAELFIPLVYEPLVRHVVEPTAWPRTFGEVRPHSDLPAMSVLSSAYDALNNVGTVKVNVVGADLVDVVDETLTALQRAGAAVVFVYLPANQPGLAFTGAGLGSLRLGFAALLPRYGDLGDALVLQWVRNPDIDDSEWEYADERVAAFTHLVLDQARSLGEAEVADRRREARRQQLLAALPTDG